MVLVGLVLDLVWTFGPLLRQVAYSLFCFFFQVGIGPCRLQNTHRISVQVRKLSMLSRMPS
jgi:hypothetical protein